MPIHGEKRRKKQHAREARVLIIAHNTRREKREGSRVEKQVLLIRCVPPPHFDRFVPFYIT
jgi:hypothetical protein